MNEGNENEGTRDQGRRRSQGAAMSEEKLMGP